MGILAIKGKLSDINLRIFKEFIFIKYSQEIKKKNVRIQASFLDFQQISDAMLRTALVMKSGDKVQLGWQGGAVVGAVLGLECLDLD